MTRQDYLNQQRLPEWLKDFKDLSDQFFAPSQYIKPKENDDEERPKNHKEPSGAHDINNI